MKSKAQKQRAKRKLRAQRAASGPTERAIGVSAAQFAATHALIAGLPSTPAPRLDRPVVLPSRQLSHEETRRLYPDGPVRLDLRKPAKPRAAGPRPAQQPPTRFRPPAPAPARTLSTDEIRRLYPDAPLSLDMDRLSHWASAVQPRQESGGVFRTRYDWPASQSTGRFVVVRTQGGRSEVGTRRYATYDAAELAAGMCRDALSDAQVGLGIDYQPSTYDLALRRSESSTESRIANGSASSAEAPERSSAAQQIPRVVTSSGQPTGDSTIDDTGRGNG